MSERKRFCVVGDPIAHSKSPVMHSAAYRFLGLPHRYEAVRATPEELPRLVRELRDGVWSGINVTVPHKRRVLDLVDDVDPTARRVGAANTLVLSRGRVVAYNTDVAALALEITDLLPERRDWSRSRALVLGKGGAARSAVCALAVQLGVSEVAVRARGGAPEAFAREMQDLCGEARVVAEPWEPGPAHEARTSLVVQCTSAGMHGADSGEPLTQIVAWASLPPHAAALDVVYVPPETPFLRAAREHGLRGANGLGMLARQGALAFELWLGLPAPYGAMLAAIL
jgi:shikimate dehydrogenase